MRKKKSVVDWLVVQSLSHVQLLQPRGGQPARLLGPWDFLSKNTGVNCHFLLQEICLTQGSNPHLLRCRQPLALQTILYHQSHQGGSSSKLLNVQLLSHVRLFCNPMDCGTPGSSVLGVFRAIILEWVAISFSRGFSQPRDQTHDSCTAGGFFTTEPPRKPLLDVQNSAWYIVSTQQL